MAKARTTLRHYIVFVTPTRLPINTKGSTIESRGVTAGFASETGHGLSLEGPHPLGTDLSKIGGEVPGITLQIPWTNIAAYWSVKADVPAEA